jgi:hypothetical protein
MASQLKVDSFTGNGAVQNIELGWIPDFLIIFNATDGDLVGLWANGMAAGTNVDIAAAAITNAADGITAYVGDSTHKEGFTVGTDYSESAKVFRYVAMRNLP